MPTISIPARGLQLQAADDENLLKVLRRHEVPIAYSCKRGDCGTCKCVLERGEVDMEAYSEQALPASQREQGLILACRAKLHGDVQLRLVDSDDFIFHPERHLVAVTTGLREIAAEVFALRLKIRFADREGQPLVFSAGQYAHLRVQDPSGEWIGRDFSMASTPVEAEYDDELEFHIRRTPQGAFSGLLGSVIKPGSTVLVDAPMGAAYFRPRHEGPLFAVSAGTGLGAMLSVVQTALDNGKTENVVLYAGFRTASEVYGRERIAELERRHANFRGFIVVEQDTLSDSRHGLVGDALLSDVAGFEGAKVYLAGSPAMVEALSQDLLARGVAPGDVHADAFYPPGLTPQAAAPA